MRPIATSEYSDFNTMHRTLRNPPTGLGGSALYSWLQFFLERLLDKTLGPEVRWKMNPLTIFGLFAVTAMLVCYSLEQRHPRFILAFAGACALGSVYGFLQGAWPFGLVEAIWSGVAVRRWWLERSSK